ncbi:hypothetical protein D3C71_36660 [compost metagenome]
MNFGNTIITMSDSLLKVERLCAAGIFFKILIDYPLFIIMLGLNAKFAKAFHSTNNFQLWQIADNLTKTIWKTG